MAAPVFTTWTALYQAMLTVAADFYLNQSAIASYSINTGVSTRDFSFRSPEEFQKGLQFVKQMADAEGGSAAGRTYAKNGGGGRW